MRDIALHASGALAIFTALAHGAIGELRFFPKARIDQPKVRRLMHLVWQATTVDWVVLGILLIAAAHLDSRLARQWIIAAAAMVYGFAAAGNAIASRGRHLGWVLMSGVVALALAGL
jgi:hypothetical protein